jgi:hypothetical protein
MRLFVRLAVLTPLLATLMMGAAACNNNTTTTTPTTPTTGFTVTETFTGTVTTNGATSFFFSVTGGGTVTLTLTSETDATNSGATVPPIGISLGTWNGTACSVQNGTFIDSATQGASVTATSTGAGTLCTRVYDSATRITTPVAFTLKVDHP